MTLMKYRQEILIDTTGERSYAAKLVGSLPLEVDKPDKKTGEIKRVPQHWRVTVSKCGDLKSRKQERKYHAMIDDVARSVRHLNLALDLETWKRLLVDQFKRETLKEPECCAEYWRRHTLSMIPSLDGSAMVVMGEQTRMFPKKVAVVFVEWLRAFGDERGVTWTDPERVQFETETA